jgi:hypothetical protein
MLVLFQYTLFTIIHCSIPSCIMFKLLDLYVHTYIIYYKHRGPGFDSRALLRIFLRELGLERGPLSLVIG